MNGPLPSTPRRLLRLFYVPAASLAAISIAIACGSTSNGSPTSGTDANVTSDAFHEGDSPSQGEAGLDAAPTVHDRFRHEWAITADQPATSSYAVDEGAGTVTDKVTGLTWTRDLLMQEQTTYDAGGGAGVIATASQADARAACASANVGGLAGWRLPTLVELLTIISFSSQDWNDPKAFLDTSYGAVYFTDSNTSDLYLIYDDHYHPWAFRTATGLSSIRCVRSSYGVSPTPLPPPAGRYAVKSGTVIDTVTKLEWQISTSSDIHVHSQAESYCASLSSGNDAGVPVGGATWRLPTVKEMATLWSEGAGGLEPTVFGAVNGTGYLWTSTKYWGSQSIPFANKYLRFTWLAGAQKFFTWEADQDLSYTKCVREAP